MSSFSIRPPGMETPEEKRFVEGAKVKTAERIQPLDPKAPLDRNLHVRVNDYELELIKQAAAEANTSTQRWARAALRRLAKEARKRAERNE